MATVEEMSKEFNEMMEKKGFEKGIAIFILELLVNGDDFLKGLDNIINKKDYQSYYVGMIFSEGYPKDEDGYFGENRILFFAEYSDDEEDNEDILEYSEFYEYLKATCEFYIKYHPDEKDKVNEKLLNIKEVYLLNS